MTAHVFTRRGDASAEVEGLLREFRAGGGTPEEAGFVRYFYVTRAEQTVVLVASREAPFAVRLRALAGWQEPGDPPLR